MYDAFAPVYDRLMDDFPYEELLAHFSSLVPLEGRMLEMGCGSGRVTQRLLPSSLAYWAVDISQEMLSLAARRLGAQAGLQLILERGQAFPTELDVVLAAVDVINYMDERALESFLLRSARALRAGGAIVFDISGATKLREQLGEQVFFFDEEDFSLVWESRYIPMRQGVAFDLTLFLREGDLYRKETESQFQRAWEKEEIEAALVQAGFTHLRTLEAMDRIFFAAQRK